MAPGVDRSMNLDRRAAGAGALLIVAVVLPVAWVAVPLDHEELVVLALLVAHFVGGRLAARRSDEWPYATAAAAAAAAFVAYVGVNAVRRLLTGDGISLAVALTWLVLVQIAVSVSVLGAMTVVRHREQTS